MRVFLLIVLALGINSSLAQTQPATVVVEQGKVLVLPFQQIGGDASHQFIASALAQSMIADISRASLRAIPSAASFSDPIQAAREHGAQYVVFGTYQINQTELRINGQVADVKTAQSLGSIKVTGATRDLFALEDTAGEQARRLIRPDPPVTTAASTIQPTGPVQVALPTHSYNGSDLQQAVNFPNDYNHYIYNPPAPYSPYYYGYPSFYSGYYYGYYPIGCYSGYYNYCYPRTHFFSVRVTDPGTSKVDFSHGMG